MKSRFYEKINGDGSKSNSYEKLFLSFLDSTVTDRSKNNNAVTVVNDGGYPYFNNDHGGVISTVSNGHKLTTNVIIGSTWTIEAIIVNPVGVVGTKTLIAGAINKHVVVKNGKLGSIVGTTFYDCGFAPATLKLGPFKMSAVGSGTTTRFFVNGKFVGTIVVNVADDVTTIGNASLNGEPFGTFGNVVISNRAKSDKEVIAEHLFVDYARVS